MSEGAREDQFYWEAYLQSPESGSTSAAHIQGHIDAAQAKLDELQARLGEGPESVYSAIELEQMRAQAERIEQSLPDLYGLLAKAQTRESRGPRQRGRRRTRKNKK